MPRPRRMRKRAPRRARKARVARVPRAPRAMLKSYNYTFQPNDQWIASTSNSTAGDVAIVPSGSPLSNWSLGSPVPAQSGFQFYYDLGVGMSFKLADLGNIVRFASLYDEYKINFIQVKMTYLTTDAAIQGAGILPTLNYIVETSNPAAPVTLQDVQGKAGSRTLRVSPTRNVLNLNIKPNVRVNVATAPNGTWPAKVEKAGWISCLSTDVVHYGGALWVQNMYLPVTSNSNTGIQFEYKFNVSFRGAHGLY